MLTYADRKEINKKNKQEGARAGGMRGCSEGRRLEFSTSVTLAGLSIMCNAVEPERWSECGSVGCLQTLTRFFSPMDAREDFSFFVSFFI